MESTIFPRISCLGPSVSEIPETGVDGGNTLSQKIAEATRCTIIRLDIHLNGMVDQADMTHSLTV